MIRGFFMRPSISPADLKTLRHEVDIAARRLLRKLRLPYQELADLRQEFLLDLIARFPAYDPARGTVGAFAGIVAANKATRLARQVRRERRLFGFSPVSLDAPLPDGDGAVMGDLVSEAESLAAMFGQRFDAIGDAERRMDMERALGRIERHDGALCAALSQASVGQLAAQGSGARSSLYRRVKEVRMALLAHGLKAA